MDQLKRMAIFATVVEQRSMRAAAQALGMTPSAVSQQIRALEDALGVSLLHRSTRKLALTEAGARYHAGCAAMLAAARSAEEALAALRDAPEGELRIAAPVGFAGLIALALGPLLVAHPRLRLQLLTEDQPTDLIAERIDLALRVGAWADSSLVARRLGSLPMALYAAPSYLARRGTPATPEALAGHELLAMSGRPLELLGADGRALTVAVAPRVLANTLLSLQPMCIAGLGIAALATPAVEEDLRAGRLLPLLAGWRLPALDVWAVTPRRDAQPAKVRHALEALRRQLGGEAVDWGPSPLPATAGAAA